MSDPRLSGPATVSLNWDRWTHPEADAGDVALFWGDVVIDTAGGTWEGSYISADGSTDDMDARATRVIQLSGSGDHEGWSAVLYGYETRDPFGGEDVIESYTGLLFPGDLPAAR